MKFIGEYKEMNPNYDYPSIKDFFEEKPYDGQDRVAEYLKNGAVDMVSFQIPKDIVSGERIPMTKVGMNDGEYTWFNTLAYYVEKYNLRLPKDFEEKILKK